MSIERFLAIYFPIRTKTLTSKKKLIMTMVVTALAMAALNLHFFWTYKIKIHNDCNAVVKYKLFLTQFWPWIKSVFYSLLPFIIQISANTAIILKIVHSNYVRKHSMNMEDGAIKLTNMTLTLLSVSFVFLAATTPMVVYRFASYIIFFWTNWTSNILDLRR